MLLKSQTGILMTPLQSRLYGGIPHCADAAPTCLEDSNRISTLPLNFILLPGAPYLTAPFVDASWYHAFRAGM